MEKDSDTTKLRILDSLRCLIAAGEGSRHSKPNCLKFLVCLKYIKVLLDDSDSCSMVGEPAALLDSALKEAKVLMETSGSKIYRVWRCQQLTVMFESVTSQIDDAISQMFLSGSQVQSQAEHCLLQLRRTNYFVDISDERLAEEIEFLLNEHRSLGAVATKKLQKLASKLDIRCNKTLANELEALQRDEENAKSHEEKEQIRELMSLFARLQAGATETKQDRTTSWGVSIPVDFRCPLSLELMVEPVIVASGQTYERAYIQKWLDQGNNTCPKTRQVLLHDNLIPNYTVKALITSWCEANNVTSLPDCTGFDAAEKFPPEPAECSSSSTTTMPGYNKHSRSRSLSARSIEMHHHHHHHPQRWLGSFRSYSFPEKAVKEFHETSSQAQVSELVADLSSTSTDVRKYAAAELRLLAKNDMQNRILIAEAGAMRPLVALLDDADLQTQENAVTALLNLSINDNNKAEITKSGAIDPLVRVLRHGSAVAKENAAATLFSLSVVEDNKTVIGAAGAVQPLVDLLASGSPRGKKDAATALFNLSVNHDNKSRIIKAGAVKPLVELLGVPALGMVDKAVAILANLSTVVEGRVDIAEEGGISALVEVVEAGSPRGRENAAAALLHLCTNSNKHRSLVLQEGAVPPLHALSQSGTARAKEKALALLRHFREQRCR